MESYLNGTYYCIGPYMLYIRKSRNMIAATAANGDGVRVWQCKCRLHVRKMVHVRVVQCYHWRGINSVDCCLLCDFWQTRPQRDRNHPKSNASDPARSQQNHYPGHFFFYVSHIIARQVRALLSMTWH